MSDICLEKKETIGFRDILNNKDTIWRCEVEVENWEDKAYLYYFLFTLPMDIYCEETNFELDNEEFCNLKKEFAMQQNEVVINFEGNVSILITRKIYNKKGQLVAQSPLQIDFGILHKMKIHAEKVINILKETGQLQ